MWFPNTSSCENTAAREQINPDAAQNTTLPQPWAVWELHTWSGKDSCFLSAPVYFWVALWVMAVWRKSEKHTAKPRSTFVSGQVSLSYLHVNACYRARGRPSHPTFRAGGAGNFSKRQCCATYQDAYSKARSSHPFSLILLGNILSLKKKKFLG